MDKMEKLNIIGMFLSALSLVCIGVYAVLKVTEASSEPVTQQTIQLYDEYPYPAEPSGSGWITPLRQEMHRLCLEYLCQHTTPPCCSDTWSIPCQEQYRECMDMVDCTKVVCDIDPFCCNHSWDDWCQAQYVDCLFNNFSYEVE